MPKIDLEKIPQLNRTGYPAEYAAPMAGRWVRRLAPATGLTEFGVSQVTLKPGGWSSQRHWHEGEDEFLVMLSGHAVLVDDSGRIPLGPGDCAAFPKADGNGHHLVNESDADCVFIAVGRPASTDAHYPDIDMRFHAAGEKYVRRDGSDF